MKQIMFVIICLTQINIAQIQVIDDDPTLNVKPELYLWNELSTSQSLSLELLTTAYSFGHLNSLTIAIECENCGGGTVENGGGLTNIGWDLIKEYNGTSNNRDFFGWGLYKVFHPLSNQYFYLDFRDGGFDRVYPPPVSSPDSHIKLLTDGELTYAYTDNITPRSVENGERVNIWEEWGYSEPDYSDFPSDFWENSLGLDRTNDHPVLLWIPRSNTSNITGYKIYRAFSPSYDTNPDTDFYEIGSKSSNHFNFVDESIISNENTQMINVYYKVKLFTNTTSFETEFVHM